jgi:hypothetical protein
MREVLSRAPGHLYMPDFFISYTSADRAWAEWIGFVLEEEGYSVIIQAWDFRPGSNFVQEMQRAAIEAQRTIMVLSPDYLKSQFASSEWAAAFGQDPKGLERKLVPVMVRPCEPLGLLSTLVHIRLVDEDEDAARESLVSGVRTSRAKPARRPAFPGAAKPAPKAFPGQTASGEGKSPSPYMPLLKRAATDAQKRRFIRDAFDVITAHFEAGLNDLARQNESIETDFQPNTPTEFSAEVFVDGRSRCRCRIWLGGMFSEDGISYAEGRLHAGSNACHEVLSLRGEQGELYLSALLDMGVGHIEREFDTKQMTPQQAADYLWRRFLLPLERRK